MGSSLKLSAVGRLSAGHLREKKGRAMLTGLGVALGIALTVSISIINRNTLMYFEDSVNAMAGNAALTVSAGETGFASALLEKISAVSGVKTAVPMIEERTYFRGEPGKGSESVVIFGVDLLKETGVRSYQTTDQQVIEDPLVFLNQPDSII